MTFLLIALIAIFIIYTSRYVFGSYVNILSVFSLWWYFLLTIAFINFENYYSLSLFSTLLFSISPIIILLGSISSGFFLKIRPIKNLSLAPRPVSFNPIDKTLSVFLWVVVSVVVFIMYSISVISDLDFQSLRDLMWSYDAASYHPLFGILTPLKWSCHGLLLYLIFKQAYIALFLKNNQSVYYLFLNVLFYLALDISGGGRGALFTLILMSVAILLIFRPLGSKEKMSFRYKSFKNKTVYIFFSAFLVLAVITSIRSLDLNLFDQLHQVFSVYFVGPFFAFDQMIAIPPELEVSRFGLTFLGLDTILVSGIFRLIMGLDIASLLSQSSYVFHTGVDISSDVRMNAFYTFLLAPYLDGGLIFVVLFLFLLGIALPIAIQNFYRSTSMYSFFIIIFLFYYLMSAYRVNALDSPGWMIFLLIPLIQKVILIFRRNLKDILRS